MLNMAATAFSNSNSKSSKVTSHKAEPSEADKKIIRRKKKGVWIFRCLRAKMHHEEIHFIRISILKEVDQFKETVLSKDSK